MGLSVRRRATASGRRASAKSISSALVRREREKRTLARARAGVRPMAVRTWEGLGGAGLAGAAAGDGEALEVEGDDEGFGFYVVEVEVGGVGGAGGGAAPLMPESGISRRRVCSK